ncbi:MAG TPA: general secretion pathway protein GspF [Gammaproteobacteria bacterium]|nr:general secretion pathway protein GspF [Gammaproteobacteria bacterium]
MRRARTVDEYVEMMKEALYEIEDMRAAIEYDEEGMGASVAYIDDIEDNLKTLFDQMKSGDYCWNTGDLPFIRVIRDLDDSVIPFRPLLLRINDTHKNGLEDSADE